MDDIDNLNKLVRATDLRTRTKEIVDTLKDDKKAVYTLISYSKSAGKIISSELYFKLIKELEELRAENQVLKHKLIKIKTNSTALQGELLEDGKPKHD